MNHFWKGFVKQADNEYLRNMRKAIADKTDWFKANGLEHTKARLHAYRTVANSLPPHPLQSAAMKEIQHAAKNLGGHI